MRLAKLIELSRESELSQLSAVHKTDQKMVGYVNRAVIALYNKFPLRVEEAFVTLVDNKHLYRLDGSDTDVKVGGIAMGEYDLVQITEVWDEVGKLPLNDDSDPFAVFTPDYDSIQVSKAETGNYVSVMFRASHDWITYVDDGNGNATDTEVRVPQPMIEALLMYVAYKAYDSLDDAQSNKAEKYLARYREQLVEIRNDGLVASDSNNRDVQVKGFD